ncbi:MAG: hypothetical protein ACM339_14660 [Ignavibacteria bacterium]
MKKFLLYLMLTAGHYAQTDSLPQNRLAVDPYINNTIPTVVANGYKYDDSTFQTAAFFDPGYITQSIGFTYNKLKNFSTRLGIAFQKTIADQFRYYSDDPNTQDKIESFKFDTGIESVTEIEQAVMENMFLNSSLRPFFTVQIYGRMGSGGIIH